MCTLSFGSNINQKELPLEINYLLIHIINKWGKEDPFRTIEENYTVYLFKTALQLADKTKQSMDGVSNIFLNMQRMDDNQIE